MIGKSGRIVIEIEPEMKHKLYSALALNGLNLKEWFIENVDEYLEDSGQMSLPMIEDKEDQATKVESWFFSLLEQFLVAMRLSL